MIKQYTVRDIRKFILESATEFKPVVGQNVEDDNKKNNERTYKETLRKTQSYDGGPAMREGELKMPKDGNKGMQDLQYDNLSPNDNNSFKKRVKSQLNGYVDDKAEDIHHAEPLGNATRTELGDMPQKAKRFKELSNKSKEIGLTSREIDPKAFNDISSSVFENKKITTIKFKHTEFLTEGQMLNKIPDDFKVDGKRFNVSDKNGTTFLVEWADTPRIVNLTKTMDEADKISKLFNYKSGDNTTTNNSRLYEDSKISDMLSKVRLLK